MKQNKLKERREQLNLTQKQVADRVGITVQAYQRYEYGERLPRVDTAKKLSVALESTVDCLF